MQLRFAEPGSSYWAECVSVVRHRYREDYGARIDPHPDLFVLLTGGHDAGPADMAVAGLTFGTGRRPLFCEHYLDEPAERVAPRFTALPGEIGREHLVEVGPLASSKAGLGRRMIEVLPGICWCRGSRVILFTVTRPIAGLIRASGIELSVVGDARLADLPADEQPLWGNYYDHEPVVGVVDLTRFGAQLAVTPPATPAPGPVGIVAGPMHDEVSRVAG